MKKGVRFIIKKIVNSKITIKVCNTKKELDDSYQTGENDYYSKECYEYMAKSEEETLNKMKFDKV